MVPVPIDYAPHFLLHEFVRSSITPTKPLGMPFGVHFRPTTCYHAHPQPPTHPTGGLRSDIYPQFVASLEWRLRRARRMKADVVRSMGSIRLENPPPCLNGLCGVPR